MLPVSSQCEAKGITQYNRRAAYGARKGIEGETDRTQFGNQRYLGKEALKAVLSK